VTTTTNVPSARYARYAPVAPAKRIAPAELAARVGQA
jgi:hypothetical protein